MDKQTTKVFGIGLQKTGTSSLGRALEILGYRINHNFDQKLGKSLLDGNINKLIEEAKNWDAFQDNPWPMAYKEMDKNFPGSKFILTLRNEESWFKSILKHYGTREYPFEKWFYQVNHPVDNKEAYLKKFRQHNENVHKYFSGRPDDLLVVDWEKGDSWKQLCLFLSKPIPSEEFPHWNKNKTTADYLRKRIRGLKMKIRKLMPNK